MQKVFNIDWLQVNCKGTLIPKQDLIYTVQPYQTKVFSKITTIHKGNRLLCTVASLPKSPIIPPETNIIKFDNNVLYNFDLWDIYDLIMNDHGLKFNNITRLDICMDFNYFDCNMTGRKFIENFAKGKYYHHSKTNFNIHGRQKKYLVYDYLRFGSSESPISCYLYNKSQEMQAKGVKQYIIDQWNINDLKTQYEVYRLEFSLKSSRCELVNNYYGTAEKLTIKNLKSTAWLQKLFWCLVDKYFCFSIFDKYKAPKDLKKLFLFNHLNYFYTHRIFKLSTITNRSDKIYLRKMEEHSKELRFIKASLASELEDVKQNFIDHKRLREYYNRKVLNL